MTSGENDYCYIDEKIITNFYFFCDSRKSDSYDTHSRKVHPVYALKWLVCLLTSFRVYLCWFEYNV